jgi:precorrin-6A/cobalt-precorrin-6A reductase
MPEREKILILGGTREAAELAGTLTGQGHDVTTSLAGRTREPDPVSGKVRIGGYSGHGLSGAQGLSQFLKENGFDRLIDATHPFAPNISENARQAAEQTGIDFEIRTRAPWPMQVGDNWIEVADLAAVRKTIPAGARVLLALGSQYIAPFAQRPDVFFLVRMVDPPQDKLPLGDYELLIGKPSTDPDEEAAILCQHAISHIVCRNSGGDGAYAKIVAARKLGLPVIMISRSG